MLENFKLDFLDVQNEIEPPTTLINVKKKENEERKAKLEDFQIVYIQWLGLYGADER